MALKTRSRISSTIDSSNYSNLKKISELTRISISKLLDEAIEYLINKYISK
jgi:hypothetical protein